VVGVEAETLMPQFSKQRFKTTQRIDSLRIEHNVDQIKFKTG
jgi:hypothetical protein